MPASDRPLLVQALLLLALTRAGLWLLPFRALRRLLTLIAPDARMQTRAVPLERIVWAVTVASRYVPQSTCLVQALAAEALLRRAGWPAVVRFGALRATGGAFQAHAWVESDGRVVIGGDELERFAVFGPSAKQGG